MKRPSGWILLVVVAVLALHSVSPLGASAASSTEEDDIKKLFQKYVDDWNTANLDGVFALLAEDVVQIFADEPTIVGKKALTESWTQFLSDYSDKWEPKLSEIQISGELAYLRGSFVETRTPKAGGASETTSGGALWIMRRDGSGSWKLIFEHILGSGWQ